jgi:hypothetical protein
VSDNDADLIYAALSQRASEYRQGDGGNLKRKLGEIADEEESRSVAENENGLILRAMRNETTIDQNFEHKWEDLKNLTVEHKKVFDWVADNANVYSSGCPSTRTRLYSPLADTRHSGARSYPRHYSRPPRLRLAFRGGPFRRRYHCCRRVVKYKVDDRGQKAGQCATVGGQPGL